MHPLAGMPLIAAGADLAQLITASATRSALSLRDDDVLVVAQKVVSKAEGRVVDLRTVDPAPRARRLAALVGKDPRLVHVILGETKVVVRAAPGVLIVETLGGLVCANAGVDQSNVSRRGSEVALLPVEPDASARRLRRAIGELSGASPAVIISDSHGRPWREGTVGVAIGVAGLGPLADVRGRPDLYGRALRVTTIGVVDELAAAASLVMGQADEGVPAVLLRGAETRAPAAGRTGRLGIAEVRRDRDRDLFR